MEEETQQTDSEPLIKEERLRLIMYFFAYGVFLLLTNLFLVMFNLLPEVY
jgi:hypothetical protein